MKEEPRSLVLVAIVLLLVAILVPLLPGRVRALPGAESVAAQRSGR